MLICPSSPALRALTFLFLLLAPYAQAQGKPDVAPTGFNAVPTGDLVDFFNVRPVSQNAYRVLFIGDSITLHSPAPKLWAYYAGMAASDPQHDFVHLAATHMQQSLPNRAVEIFYIVAGGKIGAMLAYASAHPELKPDLIVFQGGENDPFNEDFNTHYRGLLEVFPAALRIILSDWSNPEKRDFERKETAARHLPFIDMVPIKAESGNTGNGGPFSHPGVAWHPNDQGMARIAQEVGKVFDASILPALKHPH